MRTLPRLSSLRVTFPTNACNRHGLLDRVHAMFGGVLQTAMRSIATGGFALLPIHRVVECILAWPMRYRCHSANYKHDTETGEFMICISMSDVMSPRLARGKY